MPETTLTLSDPEMDLLERIRAQQGLQTVEQAAEWLAKTRLRRTARHANGRGRALYAVNPVKPGSEQ
jgi:hypothetical protein